MKKAIACLLFGGSRKRLGLFVEHRYNVWYYTRLEYKWSTEFHTFSKFKYDCSELQIMFKCKRHVLFIYESGEYSLFPVIFWTPFYRRVCAHIAFDIFSGVS
jgi:hypothetical protein